MGLYLSTSTQNVIRDVISSGVFYGRNNGARESHDGGVDR